VQKRFAEVVMTPLTADWVMQRLATDGRAMADVVGEFIKPNDRLTSFERIELYNKQYWFRLIDIMYEDYAGIAALLGRKRFNKFAEEYLKKYPSRSGLLRNLGRKIVQFVSEAPELTAPHTQMVLEMAQCEWAQVEAFDAPQKTPLTIDDLLGKDPATTRLTLQPSITLLDLHYAVDRLLISVRKEGLRSEASNASEGVGSAPSRRRAAKAERAFVAVNRINNSVFLERLQEPAFAILKSLQAGATIVEAIEAATPEDADAVEWSAQVQEWFKNWMGMRWFCRK
jgi:hypothetical protein